MPDLALGFTSVSCSNEVRRNGDTDPALSNKNTTTYYQGAVAKVGSKANADGFMRYYIAPGVNHCAGGPGADKTDLLAALDAWVENGTAPAELTASQLAADGSTNFTRPLCRYPQYPRYTGPGRRRQRRQAGRELHLHSALTPSSLWETSMKRFTFKRIVAATLAMALIGG